MPDPKTPPQNDDTLFYVGLGAVAAAALGGAWWAQKRRQEDGPTLVPSPLGGAFLGALETGGEGDPLEVRQGIAEGKAAGLTRDESRTWIEAGKPLPVISWWVRTYLPPGVPPLNSWLVARWLKHVQQRGAWDSLLKERTVQRPGGMAVTLRRIDAIGAIQDEDLKGGIKTGVDPAFKSALGRSEAIAYLKNSRDHTVLNKLPEGWELPPQIRFLDTPAKQVQWGKHLDVCMQHGNYIDYTRAGKSYVFAVEEPAKCESAAEVGSRGYVFQHVGFNNQKPVEPCASIVEDWAGSILSKNQETVLAYIKANAADPSKIDLQGANLQGMDLHGMNLQGANLEEADLQSANLEGANLEGANLVGTTLWGMNLMYANLESANLEGANLDGANLRGANLRFAKLGGANLWFSKLEGANLQGANLRVADLQAANLEGAELQVADLKGADLKGANLKGANLEGANLEGANLEGANLKSADLRVTNLEVANLKGADLEDANLYRANLEGARFGNTTMPDGSIRNA